jgi:repressor LexA
MAKELTRRQATILQYIIDRIREDGLPPTIAEIGDHFKIASTNGVNDHLLALEKKGYIERSSKARSIRVTERAGQGLYQSEAATLPLLGRVAAGYPMFAEENIEGQVAVSTTLARPGSYCLRVQGDSMIEDGILDGDTIIVDQTVRPAPGDIVVALVEDSATVKHYFPRGQTVELRPANVNMRPIVVPIASLQLQGVVVALQRSVR